MAHCVTKWGIKLGFWEKVGNVLDVGKTDLYFRDSGDYGSPEIKVSNDWWVWKVNEDQKHTGKMTEDQSEIGIVVSPDNIVHRIRTGEYNFIYPEYS